MNWELALPRRGPHNTAACSDTTSRKVTVRPEKNVASPLVKVATLVCAKGERASATVRDAPFARDAVGRPVASDT